MSAPRMSHARGSVTLVAAAAQSKIKLFQDKLPVHLFGVGHVKRVRVVMSALRMGHVKGSVTLVAAAASGG